MTWPPTFLWREEVEYPVLGGLLVPLSAVPGGKGPGRGQRPGADQSVGVLTGPAAHIVTDATLEEQAVHRPARPLGRVRPARSGRRGERRIETGGGRVEQAALVLVGRRGLRLDRRLSAKAGPSPQQVTGVQGVAALGDEAVSNGCHPPLPGVDARPGHGHGPRHQRPVGGTGQQLEVSRQIHGQGAEVSRPKMPLVLYALTARVCMRYPNSNSTPLYEGPGEPRASLSPSCPMANLYTGPALDN